MAASARGPKWIVAVLLMALVPAAFLLVMVWDYRPVANPLLAMAPSGDARRGGYVAATADCAACHTNAEGAAFAGGLPIASPFGNIYATNITPSSTAGIGGYSLAEFANAVRNGVRKDGEHLYPAMPYPSYASLTDQDIADLYAYFKQDVTSVDRPGSPTSLPFPFNQRWGLALWNRIFTDPEENTYSAAQSLSQRGRYLVQGPGHCGSCHTPRALTMQEVAANDRDGSAYLAGSELDGWSVPSLRANGPKAGGIAAWNRQDIVDYLQTGRNAHTAVAGEMTSVIQHSTSRMSEPDLQTIAGYLKTLPATKQEHDTKTASAVDAVDAVSTETTLASAKALSPGQRLYLDNCSACHFVTGEGANGVFPALSGNSAVTADNPTALIRIILVGSTMPSTPFRPARLRMPDFGWRLNDPEVAELASFVRSAWENAAAPVAAAQVKKTRATSTPPVDSARPPELAVRQPARDHAAR